MTTANLSLGLQTQEALTELLAFKTRMQQELRGISLSLNQTSLMEGLKSTEAQGIKVNIDASALRSDVSTSLREAFAVRHRVQIDTSSLTADVKAAMSAGTAGVKLQGGGAAPSSALPIGQIKDTINAILVPAVDNLAKAAITLNRAAGAAGVRQASGAGQLRASESVSIVDSATGRRRTVTEALPNPADVRTSIESMREAQQAVKGLDNALKEIAALRVKSAAAPDARTLLGLPSESSLSSARASMSVFKEAADVRLGLDKALAKIQELRIKSAVAPDARTLLGLPSETIARSARSSADVFASAGLMPKALSEAGSAARLAAHDHQILTASMKDAHSAARGLAGSLGMLWTTWGNTAAIVGAAAIGATLRSVFTTGKDLEYQLRFVSVLSDGATVSMDRFAAAVRTSLATPKEAAEDMRALAQNGLSVKDSLTALPSILNLATAGEMSLSEAALGATGVMAAFNMSVNDLGRIGDVFAKAAAVSNTSVTGMVEAMKQASTVSDVYHVSLEQTAASLATMAKRNIEGTAAGTAFRNMWVELATPTKKASEAMQKIGLNAYDANKQLLDADTVLDRLHTSLAGLNEQSRLTALNQIFGERGAKAANALLSDLDTYKKTLKELKEESKDFTKTVVNSLSDTVQGRMRGVMIEFQLMTSGVFDDVSNSVKLLLASIRDGLNSKDLTGGIKSLTQELVTLGRFVVEHGRLVLTTFAVWKGTQWVLGARAAFLTLRAEMAATQVTMEATAIGARAMYGALSGGLTILATLAVEYLLLRDRTDSATASQLAYNASLREQSEQYRTTEKSLKERRETLEKIVALQRSEGLSAEEARKRVESGAAADKSKGYDNEYARVAALKSENENKLAAKQAEAKKWWSRGMDPGDKLKFEIGSLQTVIKAQESSLEQLRMVRNDAELAANEQSKLNDAQYESDRLDWIKSFKRKVEEAVSAQPSLAKKLNPLANIEAPQDRDAFEKFKKAQEAAFNAGAKGVDFTDSRDTDKLRRAKDAYDNAKVAHDKSSADLTYQANREANQRLQDDNQQSYDTDLISYSEYLRRKHELVQQDRAYQEQVADELANSVRAAADAKRKEFDAAKPKSGSATYWEMKAEIERLDKDADDAKAKSDKVKADNARSQRTEQFQVSSDIRGKAKSAKDDLLDSYLPGGTRESKLAREAADMRARIAIYKEGSDERIALEKAVDEYVQIAQQRIRDDSLKTWVESLSGSLRKAAEGFAGLVQGVESLMEVSRNRAEQDDEFTKLKKESKNNPAELALVKKREQESIRQTERQQIASYASMAKAAKGFFKEGTGGYKAMHAAEQALRTYQLVMSSETMVKELAAIGARVAAWITGDQTMTTQAVAGSIQRTGAAMGEGQAKAIAAVANQGSGDPYSAFPRIAAMAAIMAALGFAVSSRGGSSSHVDAKAVQAAQGTGTVFGDSSAKSESIKKSIDRLKDVDSVTMNYSGQMLASLRNIESALSGVAGQIIRSGGSLTGAGVSTTITQANKDFLGVNLSVMKGALGIFDKFTGGAFNKVNSMIFGSTKTSLADAGIQFYGQSLDSIINGGIAASGYQTVEKKKKALFGLVKSSSTSTSYQNLDPTVSSQLTKLVQETYNSVIAANSALGESAEATRQKLAGLTVDLGRISLKGLNASQIQEQLSAVFGAFGDRLAMTANSTLTEFQKAGEGYYETLVRVATGSEQAKVYLDRLGISMVGLQTVTDKQGDVTAELVRQSILAVESSSGIGQIIDSMSGAATDIVNTYKSLRDLRQSLVGLGNTSIQVTSALVQGAGSLDELETGIADFGDKFYAGSEAITMKTAQLKAEFDRLGIAMPTTSEGFRSLLNGIDGTSASGQKLYGSLVVLSGAFADLVDTTKQFNSSKTEMQIALLRAQGKTEAALALERQNQLDQTDPLLQALQLQTWAAEDLAEKMNKLTDAGKTLADFVDSLTSKVAGSNSLNATRDAYLSNLNLARQDNVEALGKTSSLAQSYLDAAKASARTSYEYTAVVGQVRAELDGLNATKLYRQSVLDASGTGDQTRTAFDSYVDTLLQRQQSSQQAMTDAQSVTNATLEALRVESKAAAVAASTYLYKASKILERWEAERTSTTTTP